MKKKVAEFSQGAVYAYTIQNEAIHMTALNFGAVITELKTSDRSRNSQSKAIETTTSSSSTYSFK